MALLTPNKMNEQEIEKLAEEAHPLNPLLHNNRIQNTILDEQRKSFIKAFIAGAKSQSMSEWVSVEILRFSEPWSLLEVMKKLVEASDILLHQKDYDRLGWEEHEHAFREGKKIIQALEQTPPPKTDR